MMEQTTKSLGVLLGSVLLFWSGIFAQNSSAKEQIFEIDNRKRIYYLYLPENLPKNAPLVFVLHGYGGSARGMMGYSKMNLVADKHKFAVCYPQGNFGADEKNSWNAAYSNPDVDDVKFLSSLAVHLQKTFHLSRTNTFCTGMSNGADMSYVLACEKPEQFAAVAPVAGCMMQSTFDRCKPSKAIPIFEIHGTADDITLWDGDPDYSKEYGGYLGTKPIIDFWVKQNQCSQSQTDTLPDIDTTDGSFVIRTKYTSSTARNEVWLYTLQDGKHDWPGVWGNKDFDTSEEVWKFFQQFIE